MSAALDLARQLIRCPSYTARGNIACQKIIMDRLRAGGCEARTIFFGNESNLLASHGVQEPILAFLGHTDAVPPVFLQHLKSVHLQTAREWTSSKG